MQNQWSFVRKIHRWLYYCVTKTSQPVASYTIWNTQWHIWTNSFITAFNNTYMRVLRKYITSQWRYARDMVSQITGKSTVTVVFRLNKCDIKAQHYWPFVRETAGNLLSLLSSPLSSFSSSSRSLSFLIFNYYHYSYFQILLSLLLLSLLCRCDHDNNYYCYYYQLSLLLLLLLLLSLLLPSSSLLVLLLLLSLSVLLSWSF